MAPAPRVPSISPGSVPRDTGAAFAPGSLDRDGPRGRREVRREVKELKGKLRSPHGDARRRAVARLAALGSREAFELVVEALADTSAEPADEAQLSLPAFEASLGTEAVQKALLGRQGLRSKDSLVRLRVAEALGRLKGPVNGEALARRVDRREPEVARALLWSIERLATAGQLEGEPKALLEDLKALVGRRVPDAVRAAALQAIVHVDAGALEGLAPKLARISGGESHGSWLLASLHAGRETGDLAAARREVCRALRHASPGVRAMAIRLFPEMEPSRADLAELAARLESEPRMALRTRLVATLQRLTGLKHRDHAAAWAHAVQTLPEDWIGARLDPASDPDDAVEERGSAATLERLGPESDRLAVLVDFSGSLWNEREDGSCRKDLLDPEMDRLLDRIDPESQFLLVPFTAEPHPFSDEPMTAGRRELGAAKKFFRKATMRGQGNLFGAAQVALAHPELDRILILTDGAPTGGERWNVDLMGELLLERTRFRPVIFDFVLLDAPPRLQRTWARLAQRTGGRTLCLHM